ncbi:DUF4279 domain-containing protein [Rugosimonospora africana]|uniref:DUF4279 domain-containing protein n=1 Tax=Rugosimonospora africana TaxID=556532 RepID=UPI0019412756
MDQQINQVLDRLEPYAGRIGELVARSNADAEEPSMAACLEIVRWYTPAVAGGDVPDRNFLGWVLDRRALAFLALTGAVVDVDEYDGS